MYSIKIFGLYRIPQLSSRHNLLCRLLWRNGAQVALTHLSVHSNYNMTCPGPLWTRWRRGTLRSPSWTNSSASRLPYHLTQNPTSRAFLIKGLLKLEWMEDWDFIKDIWWRLTLLLMDTSLNWEKSIHGLASLISKCHSVSVTSIYCLKCTMHYYKFVFLYSGKLKDHFLFCLLFVANEMSIVLTVRGK